MVIPFVITRRPATASRPSHPLNPSSLAPQFRLLLTIVHVHKLYLLTYLQTNGRIAASLNARYLTADGACY